MAKVNKCGECKHFIEKNCTHKKNIALRIKYNQESEFYISTPDGLNKDGKCENYAKLPTK